jgi:hypothetical protein
MSFPTAKSLKMPILHELVALGGADDLRFLYGRLVDYFPQIDLEEISEIQNNSSKSWRKLVQRSGKELDDLGLIVRRRGHWEVTEKGRSRVKADEIGFEISKEDKATLNHQDIQQMLVEIGDVLGFYSEMEFEYYDVVWREVPRAGRLSHVFEVQSKGNIDSAFAKLKRAFQAQRSKIYLIIATERDLRKAKKSLTREFFDIEDKLTILTFSQIQQFHQNINSVSQILRNFLDS